MSIYGVLKSAAKSFAFVRVTHSEVSSLLILAPLAVTLALFSINYALLGTPGLLNRAFFANVLTIVVSLPGFLIAALAAVATFPNKALDEEIPPPTPVLHASFHGQIETVTLTFRVYLSLLFGYLAAFTLVLTFVLSTALAVKAPGLKCLVASSGVCSSITEVFRFGGLFLSVHVLVVALYGLYFIGWRMHVRS